MVQPKYEADRVLNLRIDPKVRQRLDTLLSQIPTGAAKLSRHSLAVWCLERGLLEAERDQSAVLDAPEVSAYKQGHELAHLPRDTRVEQELRGLSFPEKPRLEGPCATCGEGVWASCSKGCGSRVRICRCNAAGEGACDECATKPRPTSRVKVNAIVTPKRKATPKPPTTTSDEKVLRAAVQHLLDQPSAPSQRAFAEQIGCDFSNLSKWLRGKRPLSLELQTKLERVTQGQKPPKN
jgi:hypothetical protein